jgi:DNA-binding NtrC family response regulator
MKTSVKLLIVDDEISILRALERILFEHDYEVT